MSTARFGSVILDVDSTLSGIEGIDWLAGRRGTSVAAAVAQLTERAMTGEITLEEVYALRLNVVQPTRTDCAALAEAYVGAIAPNAGEVIADLRAADVVVHLVSGGLRNAIVPLAAHVGLEPEVVHAVDLEFDASGNYVDYDRGSPLATQHGKGTVAERLALVRPVLAVGDGATDAAMKASVDTFGAFTGFAHRDAVVNIADVVFQSFSDIRKAVLS